MQVISKHHWSHCLITEQFAQAKSPDVMVHASSAALIEAIKQNLADWRAGEVTVLVIVTIPSASSCTQGAEGAPFHSEPGRHLWQQISVLQHLSSLPDHKVATYIMAKKTNNEAAKRFLDERFGVGVEITQQYSRMPTCSWVVRTSPAIQISDVTARQVEVGPLDDMMNVKIRELRRSGIGDAQLPSMEEIETHVDTKVGGQSQSGNEAALTSKMELLWVNNGSSGSTASSTRMFNKEELADVFGMKGWGMDTGWEKMRPCIQRCCPLSGGATQAPGATLCREWRYCQACDTFYQMLLEGVPPHAMQPLQKVLALSMSLAGPSGLAPGWARLASHVCHGQGCGCS